MNLRDPWDPRPFTPLSSPVPRPALPPVSAPVYNVRATEAPSFRALRVVWGLYLFINLLTPLPQDWKLLQIKAGCVLCSRLYSGIRHSAWQALLLVDWMKAVSLLSSHSLPGCVTIFRLSRQIAPLVPLPVFLSFYFWAISAYGSSFLHRVTVAMLVPCPGIPSTISFEPVSDSCLLKNGPFLRNLIVPSYTFFIYLYLPGICTSLNTASEKFCFV